MDSIMQEALKLQKTLVGVDPLNAMPRIRTGLQGINARETRPGVVIL